METEASYEFSKGWGVSLLYKYGSKSRDSVSGSKDLPYESLEDETDWTAHTVNAGLSYDTIALFQEKKFPVPIKAEFNYENVFAGSNNTLQQEIFSFSLVVYF